MSSVRFAVAVGAILRVPSAEQRLLSLWIFSLVGPFNALCWTNSILWYCQWHAVCLECRVVRRGPPTTSAFWPSTQSRGRTRRSLPAHFLISRLYCSACLASDGAASLKERRRTGPSAEDLSPAPCDDGQGKGLPTPIVRGHAPLPRRSGRPCTGEKQSLHNSSSASRSNSCSTGSTQYTICLSQMYHFGLAVSGEDGSLVRKPPISCTSPSDRPGYAFPQQPCVHHAYHYQACAPMTRGARLRLHAQDEARREVDVMNTLVKELVGSPLSRPNAAAPAAPVHAFRQATAASLRPPRPAEHDTDAPSSPHKKASFVFLDVRPSIRLPQRAENVNLRQRLRDHSSGAHCAAPGAAARPQLSDTRAVRSPSSAPLQTARACRVRFPFRRADGPGGSRHSVRAL